MWRSLRRRGCGGPRIGRWRGGPAAATGAGAPAADARVSPSANKGTAGEPSSPRTAAWLPQLIHRPNMVECFDDTVGSAMGRGPHAPGWHP